MSSSSKPSLSYASVVKGSSSDSQDEGDFSPLWLHRFQRCSETNALNIALEESVRVSINVTLLINTDKINLLNKDLNIVVVVVSFFFCSR